MSTPTVCMIARLSVCLSAWVRGIQVCSNIIPIKAKIH